MTPGGFAPRSAPSIAGKSLPRDWHLQREREGWRIEWPWRRGGELWTAALMLVFLIYAGVAAMHLIDEPSTRRGLGQLAWLSAGALGILFGTGLILAIRDLLGWTQLLIRPGEIITRAGPLALGTPRRTALNAGTRFIAMTRPRPHVMAVTDQRCTRIADKFRSDADATFIGHALAELATDPPC